MSDEQTYAVFEWINKDYLQTVLESHVGKAAKLIEHEIRHATAKGENYFGAMFRAELKYTNGEDSIQQHISLIIKARLDDEILNEISEEFNIFERESQAYKCIIKDSMKLLYEIQDPTVFAPSLIFVDEKAIIQEDLSVRGYRIKDCRKKLNLKECKMVLEKVAKFHATTAVLHSQNPDMFRYHMQSNITENPNPLHMFYQNTVANCIKYAKTVPELQCYIEKLEAYKEQVVTKMIDVFKRDESTFNVLNHGDLWVDYQEGFFGSPGIDLNWFIFTSCNQEVLTNDIQTLYQFYYNILADTLKKLKYPKDIPSFVDIQKEIHDKCYHGLTTLICFTAIFLNEKVEYADAVNFISDSEECEQIRTVVFNNCEYAKALVENLPIFVKIGIF